ncbi:MAG: type III-B CRISPR module-associated protein Cmr5, partial [Anaerolineales bacterium]|nr:type III-B CRISPR module-associated protein Cmr5 [Anaerolineales bacterium]
MSHQRSLEQNRAQFAWDKITAVKNRNKDFAQKYGQLARSAAAEVQANGLAQTLAFWKAKGKGNPQDEHQVIYQDVSAWVSKQMKISGAKGLLEWIVDQGTTTNQYRQATAEAMAFLLWLKRFAEAEL